MKLIYFYVNKLILKNLIMIKEKKFLKNYKILNILYEYIKMLLTFLNQTF